MLVGIDPFSDDDPMMVYQKILKGKIKFPSNFDSYLIYLKVKKRKKFNKTFSRGRFN
jgi:hypothetical protein